MAHPMGESGSGDIRVEFDRRVKLEFHGSSISSDGGLLIYRELEDALGLMRIADKNLSDLRKGKNKTHLLLSLFRQSIFGRLAGYEDVNDAEWLSRDPVMRQIVGGRAVEHSAASSSQMARFETELLEGDANLQALCDLSGAWIDRLSARQPLSEIVLDMDSSVSPTHGAQQGTAYNGHFTCMCYHPLFVFNQRGQLERSSLRSGNVHSADAWQDVLMPVIERYRAIDVPRFFRGDAAFANPELYEALEAEGYTYAIRLKRNAILNKHIAHLMTRPVRQPPHRIWRAYADFSYCAASWNIPRRVIAKVEWHPGELFARVGFIVTNMIQETATDVVAFYNKRGTAEQYIKEGKNAITWTRLSCKKFRHNEVRLQLHALAYNLGVFLQSVDLPEEVKGWSLTSLQTKLIKIGAKVIRHSRYITFQMAEVALPRSLFARILAAIQRLRAPPLAI
jgi:hypothetical protein